MGQETKTVRPFDVPESLERLFHRVTLRVGAQHIQAGKERLVWDDADTYGGQEVELEWSAERDFDGFQKAIMEGAEAAGIAASNLSLLVLVTSGYLGTTEVVHRETLGDGSPAERVLKLGGKANRAVGLRVVSDRPNRITAYLVLNREIARKPLQPWRKGTWLARREFRIGLEAPSAIFRPLELDDKRRKEFRLLPGTVRYLRSCDPFDPESPPEMYVDSEILQAVSRDPKSATSQMVQRELAAYFIRSVVAESTKKTDERRDGSWSELEDSLLGRIVKYLEGKGKSDEDYEKRLAEVREDPERVVALAEDRLGVRAAILKVVQPGTSQ